VRVLLLLALFGQACSGEFVSLPPEIGWVAWLEVDPSGRLLSASPLIPIEDAPSTWAIDGGPVLFVGFEREPLEGLLSRSAASGWRDDPLRSPAPCEATLVPSWHHAGGTQSPPPLTADWTSQLCGSPGLATPSCAVCAGQCELEVVMHPLAFDGAVPMQLRTRGLVQTGETTLMAALQSRDPALPDHVAVIELGPGGPIVTTVEHESITETIAFDGSFAFVGDENGAVVRLRRDGTEDARIATATTALLVAAAQGTDVYAFDYGGIAYQVEGFDAGDSELGRPILDIAASPSEVVVLRGRDLRRLVINLGVVPLEFTVLLPEPIAYGQYDPDARPRAAIVGGIQYVAARDRPVQRLRDSSIWEPVGWPHDLAEARAFAGLAGGTLIAGGGADGGLLYFERFGASCQAAAGLSHVAALASGSDDSDVAYGLIEAAPVRPQLLEIRIR
jgi:hypothetical protein